jgi:hypothetical protein
MRIDSSGNLLVGKTSADHTTAGISLYGAGIGSFVRDGAVTSIFNRLTSDGTIAEFRKDGVPVGGVGVSSANNLTVGSSSAGHAGFELGNQFLPLNAGAASDGELDLGITNRRFRNFYLSSAVYAGSGFSTGDLFVALDGDADGITTGYKLRTGVASTGSASHLAFTNPNGIVGTITTNGSATSYNTSSDYRLKENVVSMDNASDRVLALNPVRFNFIADPNKTVDGFLAHEAQEVVPEAVHGVKDEVDDEGNAVYQGIDQSKLVPLLTKALQEALTEIQSLKARVSALETL